MDWGKGRSGRRGRVRPVPDEREGAMEPGGWLPGLHPVHEGRPAWPSFSQARWASGHSATGIVVSGSKICQSNPMVCMQGLRRSSQGVLGL